MDYKRIIKSKAIRQKILRCLSWIPDKTMIKIQYRMKTGKKLDLKKPLRYTEKLQWYKLYYRDELMTKCVDKYDVRKYIEELGYGDLLLKCYGVYSSSNEINFDDLPNAFVIKDTLGGGGDSVIICRDKASLNIDETKKNIDKWIRTSKVKNGGREWPYYSGKKSRIIIEEYIETSEIHGLIDYKFFCFNGKFKYMYLISDRKVGVNAKLAIYDLNLNKLSAKRTDELWMERDIKLPDNIDKMIDISNKISAAFPHARIDLYNVNGRIIFGEITFFDGSGYMRYDPDEFDFIMGNEFVLPSNKK